MYGHEWKEAEQKFAVGDRVRVVTDRWEASVRKGSFGMVHKLVDDRGVTVIVDGGDGFDWYFKLDEVAAAPAAQVQPAPKYKVGRRVIFTDAVAPEWWFKAGETGAITGDTAFGDYIVRVDRTGPGGERDAFVNARHIEPSFLPGDKVRVTRCNGYFAAGDEGVVEKQGKYNVFVKHGPYQRVGLPIEAEKLELVEAADAKPQPKFKAGDVVRALVDDDLGEFRAGDSFVITKTEDEYVQFFDSNGDERFQPASNYILVTAAPCPQDNEQPRGVFTIVADKFVIADHRPAIVVLVKDGKPRPSQCPHVHPSVLAATVEAERLATNNPGQEFAVYQRVAGRQCEVSYEMKEVA